MGEATRPKRAGGAPYMYVVAALDAHRPEGAREDPYMHVEADTGADML